MAIKLPSYCGNFFLEKTEREICTRAASDSRSPKLCACVCRAVLLSLSSCGELTFMLGMAPLHVILQSRLAAVTLKTIIPLDGRLMDGCVEEGRKGGRKEAGRGRGGEC